MISTQIPYRYAVYFCPAPDTNWGKAGAQWLGRCAVTGEKTPQIRIPSIDEDLFLSLTSEPKRYGWHATLKAPFTLKPEFDVGDLLFKLHQLTQSLKPFDLPTLEISTFGGFISLRPDMVSEQLNDVADRCVKDLHRFASPLTPTDLIRRRKANLTPNQDKLLLEWGYPWVLDEFNFHFSLTNSIDSVEPKIQKKVIQAAKDHFEKLGVCRFDHIALVIEPEPGKEFEVIKLMELYL